MIDLTQITRRTLETQPYSWAEINNLFSPTAAATLATSFPCDHYKTIVDDDGEKAYEYEARALIAMGANAISHPGELSRAWLRLGHDLLSADYRVAMSLLTGRDLTTVPIEANVFHYGPGAHLGPHADLQDKIVTHVLYFNQSWSQEDGGCLCILRSTDPTDVATRVTPIVGNSAVLVRSDHSWHAVSRVVNGCRRSRRSLTVTFYRPGSVSTMWPPGDTPLLHGYNADDLESQSRRSGNWWSRLRQRFPS
jgi:SM-20-related protein